MISEEYEKLTQRCYVYNICHFDNIKSILQNGLLSYYHASSINHVSIANPEIQDRRDKKKVPNGLALHQYVNCFFNPRNSMLYSNSSFDNIAILCISNKVLDLPGVVVSDKNAAKNTVAFYGAQMGIDKLNFKEIFLSNWDSPDPWEKERLKAILHAEVLVPFKIESSYIKEIRVAKESVKRKLHTLLSNYIRIEVDSYMFFDREDSND